MKRRYIFLVIFILAKFICVEAQIDTNKKWNLFSFCDLYYSYDFSKDAGYEKPDFLYNHKRNFEPDINLFLMKFNYTSKFLKLNAGVITGNYAVYNLANEPALLRNIYEFNAGLLFSKKNNLWLEAGIIPSHLGFESIINTDCWTATRSLLAENSPYYESGVKLSFTNKSEKLYMALLYLNGWQRMHYLLKFDQPALGSQILYKKSKSITFNYSNFVGWIYKKKAPHFRQFHNLYFMYDPDKGIDFIVGLDLGVDYVNYKENVLWYSPVLILRKSWTSEKITALRIEYYHDLKQVIMDTGTPNGFQTIGISSNFDYELNKKIKVRSEGKYYIATDPIFYDKNRDNFTFTLNILISFVN